MEFRILGPLQVVEGQEPIVIGGRRERSLLALLLLSANQVQSAERLAHDLWGGEPPGSATESLRVYVSRLRRALGPAGDGIVCTEPPGYVARIDPEAVDATRFEALVVRGRVEATAGRHGRAAEFFRAALALWRGPALADLADAPFARAEAARLEEARGAVLEERLEAELACGGHREMVAELDALTKAHPLRERLWAIRMLALYRSGRQAESLRAFQELRRVLAGELGLEPSSALRKLETAILRQDPEIDWRPSTVAASAFPLPGLLTGTGRVFVDRETELDGLRAAWQEAWAGARRVVLVGGEPGVGKSRLAAVLAREVHTAGAVVLAGRCDEDLAVPYQPFVEALRHFLDHTADAQLAGRLGRFGGELSRVVPELGERIPSLPPPLRSDPETERYRLFDAVAGWLAATSSDSPILIVLEDLQWAAKPTLLLLRHVVRVPMPMRLLVVGTYRDTEIGPGDPVGEMLADLRRDEVGDRILLSGLDEAGVLAVMEQAAGHDLDKEEREVARAVHEETAGNPFFVWEVLRHLAETGGVVRREGRWVAGRPAAELTIPEGVRDVVRRRLSRLATETNRMLAVAAVAGAEFELQLLQVATGVEEEVLLSSLEEALAARLVAQVPDEGSRYRFSHALVRATLYGELSPARRALWHRRLAAAMESVHHASLDDHVPALAHHLVRGAAPGSEEVARAITYATRAGDRALAQLAHDEAARWYGQAVPLLDAQASPADEVQRCDLLISLGEAQRRAGNADHRFTLLSACRLAQRLSDPVRLARAALANHRGFSVAGEVDAERVAMLEAGLEALGPDRSALRARLLVTLANELEFSLDRERRRRLITEGLGLARDVGDPPTLGYALATGYFPTLEFLDIDQLEENVRQLVAVSEQLDDPALRFWGELWGCVTATLVGDLSAAHRDADAAGSLAEELHLPFMRWVAAYGRANLATIAGPLGRAEALIEDAYQFAQAAAIPDAFRNYGAQVFWVRYHQGRLDELLPPLTRAAERERASPLTRIGLCLALCASDQVEAARPAFAEMAATEFSLPFGYTWLYGMAMLAEVAARLGDAQAATLLLDQLVPHHALLATWGGATAGPVAHHLGLLAVTLCRHDEAERYFEEAAETCERIGSSTWLTRAWLEWGSTLLAGGDPGEGERARKLLSRARAAARELGLRTIERRAVTLLR